MTRTKHFFFWLLLFIFSGNHVFGQSTVNLVNSDFSIRAALYELEKQTGYSVGFDETELNAEKKINVSIRTKSIDDALTTILLGTGCTYSIKNKHIIIEKAAPQAPVQQGRMIRGQVFDKDNEPLIGASIIIEGKTTGTITDIDGSFTIEVESSKDVLIVSYVGYTTKKMAIGNNSVISVILQEDTTLIDEVVVVGYNTIRKKDLTTAVAIVSTADIEERPLLSAAHAIQGKAAGVQVVQYSGEPGGGLSIRVRGATSIEAGNEPLYVVDGIPMSSISDISANDIESMQVLKDASSAAIYGARAANGVVLITTKRGQIDAKKITFSSYAGFSKLGKKIDALNTEQYKDYIKDLNKHTNTTLSIPDEETRYTNWTDEFFRTGSNQNYQVSFSNGSEKMQYYVSAGYIKEKGIIEKAQYERYNFRANMDNEITKWLKLSLNLGYSNSNGQYINQNSSSMRSGSILSVINTPPYMQVWDENNPGWYDEFAYGSRILHPIAANAADNTYKESKLVASLNLNFSITKNLQYKLHFGLDETSGRSHYYLDPNSNSDGRATKGYASEETSRNFEWLWENLLTYEKSFADKHNLSLLGGATLQKAEASDLSANGTDMFMNFRYISGANIINPTSGAYSNLTDWSLASFLGRMSYDYKSKYLFSANIRADGSSKFTPGSRWGIFPSASAAWRISSEPFMQSLSNVISDMKIRGGWGMNGNQAGIGNYDWMMQYEMSRQLPTTENPYPGMSVKRVSLGNRELTWETTTQYNAGIDLSLFNSRLNVTLDAYYKKTKDLLMTLWLPGSAGVDRGIQRNDGAMLNKGLEIEISSKNFVDKFKWNTDFNIAFNKNKVTNGGLTASSFWATTYTTAQPAIILRKGVALGSFYGYVSEGVDPETGDIIYTDLDGNDIITPEDRKVIGCAQPKFVYGITNSFSYAGFDLSVFLQGSYGNDIFNASKIDMTSMLDFRNQSTDVLRRWKRPGMITDIPRPGNADNLNNSTRFVEDGSYLRVKTITLSYNFNTNKKFFKALGITRLQPYITGHNLLTWTDYSGYDPEVNAYGRSSIEMGVDYGTFPQSKAVIFGVNLQF